MRTFQDQQTSISNSKFNNSSRFRLSSSNNYSFGLTVAASFFNEHARLSSQSDDILMMASSVNNASFSVNRELIATILPNNDLGKMILLSSSSHLNTDLWGSLDNQAMSMIKAMSDVIKHHIEKGQLITPFLHNWNDSKGVAALTGKHLGMTRAAYYIISEKSATSTLDDKRLAHFFSLAMKKLAAGALDTERTRNIINNVLTAEEKQIIISEIKNATGIKSAEFNSAVSSMSLKVINLFKKAIAYYSEKSQDYLTRLGEVAGSDQAILDVNDLGFDPEKVITLKDDEMQMAFSLAEDYASLFISGFMLSLVSIGADAPASLDFEKIFFSTISTLHGDNGAIKDPVVGSTSLTEALSTIRSFYNSNRNGLGETVLNLTSTFQTLMQFRESIIAFSKEKFQIFRSSYISVEDRVRNFRDTCKHLSLARSAAEAMTLLESFERDKSFSDSLAGVLYSLAMANTVPDRTKLMSVFEVIADGSLAEQMNTNGTSLLGSFSGHSDFSEVKIPGLTNNKHSFEFSYTPTVTVNPNGNIHSIDGEDPLNMVSLMSDSGNDNKSQYLSPSQIFAVLAMNVASNEEILNTIASGRKTSFIMDDIQMSREVKDQVLARVKALSLAFAYELAQKKRAFDIWAFAKVSAIYDFTNYFSKFLKQVDDDFLFLPSREASFENAEMILEECRSFASEANLPLNDPTNELSLPLVRVEVIDTSNNRSVISTSDLVRQFSEFFSSKKKIMNMLELVRRYKRILFNRNLGEYSSIRYFSSVLDLNASDLAGYSIFSGNLESFNRFEKMHQSEFYTYEADEEDRLAFLNKVLRKSGSIVGTFAYRFKNGDEGIKDVLSPGFSNSAGIDSAEDTAKAPDFITDSVVASLEEEIKPTYVDRSNHLLRLNYLNRTKGDVFMALLNIAADSREGHRYGLISDRVSVNLGTSPENYLEYMLSMVGLSSSSSISAEELPGFISLITANKGKKQFPFVLTKKGKTILGNLEAGKDSKAKKISLAEIIAVKSEIVTAARSMSNTWMMHLRNRDYLDVLMADSLAIDASKSLRFFSVSKSNFYGIDSYKGQITLAVDFEYVINPSTVVTATDVNIISHSIVQSVADVFRPQVKMNSSLISQDRTQGDINHPSLDSSLTNSLSDKAFIEDRIAKARKGLEGSKDKRKEEKNVENDQRGDSFSERDEKDEKKLNDSNS